MIFIAADLGTTNCKVALLNEEAEIQHSFYKPVTSYQEKPGWHEQDAEEIFEIFFSLLKQAIEYAGNEAIQFVSFSAAMHSLLAVDKQGKPLMKALTWADNRSAVYAEKIKNSKKATDIFRHTGTPIHAMSPLVKILWLKKERREVFDKAHKFISIKEYIFYRLFNTYIIDYSIASATGLFDIYKLGYYKPSLKIAGIKEEQLSKPVLVTHVEYLTDKLKTELQLQHNMPFVAGGSDGCLANLGDGLLDNKKVSVTVGTSAAVRVSGSKPLYDEKQRLFSYALDEKLYVSGGPLNNGGFALQWFANNILQPANHDKNIAIEDCISLAMQAAPGAGGLIFLPYILGERAPIWDAKAKGAFVGLLSIHTTSHMARAVLEGICFAICQVLKALEDVSGKVKEIYLNGGLSASEEWAQMLSDISGKKVMIDEASESSLSGALYIGMKACGFIKNYSSINFNKSASKTYQPDIKLNQRYVLMQSIYNELYPSLNQSFENLHTLQQTLINS